MEQISAFWGVTAIRRKIIAGVAALAMFAAILAMTGLASRQQMTLLYSGLEAGQAGDVVKALEARGVEFEVRSGAIFVSGSQRDSLRMTLASEGLPANSSKGYELLDTLSGFGTTAQMFDAAYWRAKEGELARTIAASPHIDKARVHLANSSRNPFQKKAEPTASVAVTSAGGTLSAPHAKALRFLVASAVAGLSPDNVTIVDDQGGLIGAADDAGSHDAALDKTDTLSAKVRNLLEARVGHGNAVVEVSVDTVTESESIRETVIDPESRVAISTDTEERSGNSRHGSGDVTVASNLPTGDAGSDADGNSSENTETRERVNYEVSETYREIVREPGAIKRLSVAVLVNGVETEAVDGTKRLQPRSEEELADLKELVASAVGFNEARGDVITIKSLQFQTLTNPGTEAISSFSMMAGLDLMTLIKMGILALVTLVLGLFVVRPLLKAAPPGGPVLEPQGLPSPDDLELPMFGDVTDEEPDFGGMQIAPASTFSGALEEDPVERLRGMIADRQDETVEILRNWLDKKEETA